MSVAGQVTIAEVRQRQQALLERLRKLERDMQSATLAEKRDLNSQITIVTQDIRNLDIILQKLIKDTQTP
jgi:hypothetical protein